MKVNNKRDTGEGLKEKRGEQHIPLPLSLLPLFRLFKTTAGALTGVFYLLKAETYELTLHARTHTHTQKHADAANTHYCFSRVQQTKVESAPSAHL